jgi:hypothetical protein
MSAGILYKLRCGTRPLIFDQSKCGIATHLLQTMFYHKKIINICLLDDKCSKIQHSTRIFLSEIGMLVQADIKQ